MKWSMYTFWRIALQYLIPQKIIKKRWMPHFYSYNHKQARMVWPGVITCFPLLCASISVGVLHRIKTVIYWRSYTAPIHWMIIFLSYLGTLRTKKHCCRQQRMPAHSTQSFNSETLGRKGRHNFKPIIKEIYFWPVEDSWKKVVNTTRDVLLCWFGELVTKQLCIYTSRYAWSFFLSFDTFLL